MQNKEIKGLKLKIKVGQTTEISHAGEVLRITYVERDGNQARLNFSGPQSFEIFLDKKINTVDNNDGNF